MALKLNTYIVNISIIIENYVIPDHVKITDGVQYKYYAILLADSIESAYEACDSDKSNKFSKFVTFDTFTNCIKVLNDKKDYPETPNMRWCVVKGDVIYASYVLKNYTRNQSIGIGCGSQINHHYAKYDIDESLLVYQY